MSLIKYSAAEQAAIKEAKRILKQRLSLHEENLYLAMSLPERSKAADYPLLADYTIRTGFKLNDSDEKALAFLEIKIPAETYVANKRAFEHEKVDKTSQIFLLTNWRQRFLIDIREDIPYYYHQLIKENQPQENWLTKVSPDKIFFAAKIMFIVSLLSLLTGIFIISTGLIATLMVIGALAGITISALVTWFNQTIHTKNCDLLRVARQFPALSK